MDFFEKRRIAQKRKKVIGITLSIALFPPLIYLTVSSIVGQIRHRNEADFTPISTLSLESTVALADGLYQLAQLEEFPGTIGDMWWTDLSYRSVRGRGVIIFYLLGDFDENFGQHHIIHYAVSFRVLETLEDAKNFKSELIEETSIRGKFIHYENENNTSVLVSPIIYRPEPPLGSYFYGEFYIRIGNVVIYSFSLIPANSRWDFKTISLMQQRHSSVVRELHQLINEICE